MNWQPMSTPPTEAGEYLLWKKDTTDGCSARLRFNPDDEYCWWTLFGWSKHTTVKKSYTHWARVTAPGEAREAVEKMPNPVQED